MTPKNTGGSLPFYDRKEQQELDGKKGQGIVSPAMSLLPFRLPILFETNFTWHLTNECNANTIELDASLLEVVTETDCDTRKTLSFLSYTGIDLGVSIPCGYWTIWIDSIFGTCYSEVIQVVEGVCALETVGLKVASCDGNVADILADDNLVHGLANQDVLDSQGNSLGPLGFSADFSTLTSPLFVCREVETACQKIKQFFCLTWDSTDICNTLKIETA